MEMRRSVIQECVLNLKIFRWVYGRSGSRSLASLSDRSRLDLGDFPEPYYPVFFLIIPPFLITFERVVDCVYAPARINRLHSCV